MGDDGFPMSRVLAVAFAFFFAWGVSAASIVPVGVLGNSGESGATLFLARGPAVAHSGAALDDSSTLWLSSGDGIARVGLDGKVLERFALGAGSRVDSSAFAMLRGSLYFLGRAGNETALFRLPMKSGAKAASVAMNLPLGVRNRLVLGAQTHDGRLLLAFEAPPLDPPTIVVAALEPDSGDLSTIGTVPGKQPESVVVDAARDEIVLGGMVVPAGENFSPGGAVLGKTPGGYTSRTTVASISLVATPSWFAGRVSLAAGALWDVSGPYGFVARMTPGFSPDPGVVARWTHELDQTTQILDLRSESSPVTTHPLLFSTNSPADYYLAEWDARLAQLRIDARIGSLPEITNVALSPSGWVAVGAGSRQLWWRWDDECTSAPKMADLSIARGTGFFSSDRLFAFGAIRREANSDARPGVPLIFSPIRGSANLALRPTRGEPLPGILQPMVRHWLNARSVKAFSSSPTRIPSPSIVPRYRFPTLSRTSLRFARFPLKRPFSPRPRTSSPWPVAACSLQTAGKSSCLLRTERVIRKPGLGTTPVAPEVDWEGNCT